MNWFSGHVWLATWLAFLLKMGDYIISIKKEMLTHANV
jgi:hypothetical protein